MAALSGKVARIKLCAQTATRSTNEAATLAPGGLVLNIDTRARRHWDRSLTSTPVVTQAGATAVAIGSSNYVVDYAAGQVTFSTARSTAAAITLDINYMTASYVGLAKGWSLDVDVNLLETTVLSTLSTATTQWRTYTPGLSGGSVTMPRYLSDSTGRVFFDLQNVGNDLILELIPSTGAGGFQGYGYVESDSNDVSIDGLAEETVTVKIDGPLTYTTDL
ncbi:MAG: hypothetical protein ABIJ75_05980 [Actinomycetota bacterium]